jgi:hypothetical protein
METATAAVKSSHAAATVATAVLGKSRLRQPAQNHESREGANNSQHKFSHFRRLWRASVFALIIPISIRQRFNRRKHDHSGANTAFQSCGVRF